ncbi:E3 ubiquitin ligase PQT3-like [Capsicum chacoense]
MAAYFKCKSAKDYDSIPMFDQFISVGNLKSKIFESKRYGRGKDFDLVVTNAQTNEDYVDQDTLIPTNTSVLIRLVPGLPRLTIAIAEETEEALCDEKEEEVHAVKKESNSAKYFQDFDCHDFGDDVYAIQKSVPSALTNRINDDEDAKIKSLTVSVGKRSPESSTRSSFLNGFGRGGMEYWKKPPSGYVCHRCNVPGHFIQHCPTNGDPNYGIKKVKPPSGSTVGVLKCNEAAFSKEVEGSSCSSSSSSKRSFRDIPPELHCPLCKGLMKDAVMASNCCLSSFCDKCIRDHIVSNSVCIGGARNIPADALLPILTLRVTINRILESSTGSSSEHRVRVHNTPANIPLPLPPRKEETCRELKTVEECPLAVEEVKMKKRKKPSDDAYIQDHVVSDSYMSTMNPAVFYPHCLGMQCMSYGHLVLPDESGFKRTKREMSSVFPSVIIC